MKRIALLACAFYFPLSFYPVAADHHISPLQSQTSGIEACRNKCLKACRAHCRLGCIYGCRCPSEGEPRETCYGECVTPCKEKCQQEECTNDVCIKQCQYNSG